MNLVTNLHDKLRELEVQIQSKHIGLDTKYRNFPYDIWSCKLFFQEEEYETTYSVGADKRQLDYDVVVLKPGQHGAMYSCNGVKAYSVVEAIEKGFLRLSYVSGVLQGPDVVDVVANLLDICDAAKELFIDYCLVRAYDCDSRKAVDKYLEAQRVYVDMRTLFGTSILLSLLEAERW